MEEIKAAPFGTENCKIDDDYLRDNILILSGKEIIINDATRCSVGLIKSDEANGVIGNTYVCWPCGETPTLKEGDINLYILSKPYDRYTLCQNWGIKYEECNGSIFTFDKIPQIGPKKEIHITRNGKLFKSLDGTKYTLEDAKRIIDKYLKNNYPVDWNSSNWKEKLIGKRISYLGFPAIITKVDDTRIWFDFYGESKFNCIVCDMWNCQVSDEAPIPHAMYDLINYPLINEYGNYIPICLLDPIKYGSILGTGTVIYPTDVMAIKEG